VPESPPKAGKTPPTLIAVAVVLTVAAAVVLSPFVVPCVLAAWAAELARPLRLRLERVLAGRRRAAAALTVLLLVLVVAPLGAAVVVLAIGARELLQEAKNAFESGSFGRALGPATPTFDQIVELARTSGAASAAFVLGTLRGSARAAIAFVVFLFGFYAFSAHRERFGEWLARSAPVPRAAFDRLSAAFYETGRGLVIGVGLTALAQGVVATIAYLALGIPRAILFGFVTAVAAIVPGVGTGFVWVPLAVALAATGHPIRALVLVACGAGVISVIDNVLRPMLARYGKLELPTFVLFASMLGGVLVLGPAGVVLGPLAARLAAEAIALARRDANTER
jgi:predicted PurR-regulated permease PerM